MDNKTNTLAPRKVQKKVRQIYNINDVTKFIKNQHTQQGEKVTLAEWDKERNNLTIESVK